MSPRPESDDPRDYTICVRVTQSEKKKIKEWVAARNTSDVIRRLLLEAAAAQVKVP